MRPFKLLSVLILAVLVIAGSTWLPGVSQQAAAEVDVYTTPGTHHVNGRDWRTTCEPYSQTQRCHTEIRATQVTQVGQNFVSKTGWYLNNLTYVASPRSLWAGNPLGNAGSWTATDGRQWRTDCDVPTTGGNGCRSYVKSHVIQARHSSGTWSYAWEHKWVFNNIVRFSSGSAPTPTPTVSATPTTTPTVTIDPTFTPTVTADPTTTPTVTADPTTTPTVTADPTTTPTVTATETTPTGFVDPLTIEDPTLRACIASVLEVADTAPFPESGLAAMQLLNCNSGGVETLRGMPEMPALVQLHLQGSDLTTLDGLPDLPKLQHLSADYNQIETLTHMPVLASLRTADFYGNSLTSLGSMPVQPILKELFVGDNQLTTLEGMPAHPDLRELRVDDNQLTTLTGLPANPALYRLVLDGNALTTLAGMPHFPGLVFLHISKNALEDLDGLPLMPDAVMLDLGRNQITSVAPLVGWTGLATLGLVDNPVIDLALLDELVAGGLNIVI